MFLRNNFIANLARIPAYSGLCFVGDDGDGGQDAGSGDDSQSKQSDGDDGHQQSGDQKPDSETVPMDAHLSRVGRAKSTGMKEGEEAVLKKFGLKSMDEVDALVEKLRAGETEADRLKREADEEAAKANRLEAENASYRQAER